MYIDKQLIIEKIGWLKQTGNALIFEACEYYVQIAPSSKNEIVCEAVSHHYHSSINIGLESSFAAMGFHLEEGGNYSRVYPANTISDMDMLADDIMKIFRDLFHADKTTPFTVTEV